MINTFVTGVLTTLCGAEFLAQFTWFVPMVIALISSSFVVMLFKIAIFPVKALFNYILHIGDKENEK